MTVSDAPSDRPATLDIDAIDPDRLLPAGPHTRAIARDLYTRVADAPIVSPHRHVPVEWIVDDVSFQDPATLLITHDHYVTRLLHASGIDLTALGVSGAPTDPRALWCVLADRWHLLVIAADNRLLDGTVHDW